MIRPFSTSNQSKYGSWLLYYGLSLTICVSFIHVQAASAAPYISIDTLARRCAEAIELL
jgi:hypothetical protein